MNDELPWFETFSVGDILESGSVTFTEKAILDYARQWDPQPFHSDPEAAANSQFGGLIASGMHVMGAMFRAMVEAGFLNGTAMGSPGMDEVRWLKPVRPGGHADHARNSYGYPAERYPRRPRLCPDAVRGP